MTSGNYYLTGNVTATSNISLASSATVNLCLNGYTLDLGIYNLTVGRSSTLNVYDCSQSNAGTITTYISNTYSGTICNNGSLNIYGGNVTNTDPEPKANAIYNEYKLTVSGGVISGTQAICNRSTSAETTISGGEITGAYYNTNYGVYNYSGAVTISGGEISGNYGIYNGASTSTTTKISGGTITGTTYGVYINYDTVSVSGGTISGGQYGVYGDYGTLNVSGGSISGDKYGICLGNSSSKAYLSGTPTIKSNSATDADIYLIGGSYYAHANGDTNAIFAGNVTVGVSTASDSLAVIKEATESQLSNFVYLGSNWELVYSNGNLVLAESHVHDFSSSNTCSCGLHSHDNGVTVFEPWTTNSFKPNSGYYYLTDDVNMAEALIIEHDVTLCLNGKTFDSNAYTISINGGSLTICDCQPTEGKMTFVGEIGVYVLEGKLVVNSGKFSQLGDKHTALIFNYDQVELCGGTFETKSDVAIDLQSGSSLYLSGTPTISGSSTDILLNGGVIYPTDFNGENAYAGEKLLLTAGSVAQNSVVVANANGLAGKFEVTDNDLGLVEDGNNLIIAHAHDDVAFDKEWTATSGIVESGNYYLTDDVTVTGEISILSNSTVNICLNGHQLSLGMSKILNLGTLSIYDCSTNGSGSIVASSNAIYNTGTLTIHGGKIQGSTQTIDNDEQGTVHVLGGEIESLGNDYDYAGILNGGTVHVSGGTIKAESYRAITMVYNSSKLYLSGTPTITGADGAVTGDIHLLRGDIYFADIDGNNAYAGAKLSISLDGARIWYKDDVIVTDFGGGNIPCYLADNSTWMLVVNGEQLLLAYNHNHSWSSAWTMDNTAHWHECFESDCFATENSQKDGYGEHDFTNGNTCICGAHKHSDSDIIYLPFTETSASGALDEQLGKFTIADGNYYLAEDFDATCRLVVAKNSTVSICLNGKTLDYDWRSISNNGTLNIYDCQFDGVITSNGNGIATIINNATLNIYGGTIQSNQYRAVANDKSTSTLYLYDGGSLTSSAWEGESKTALENKGIAHICGGSVIAESWRAIWLNGDEAKLYVSGQSVIRGAETEKAGAIHLNKGQIFLSDGENQYTGFDITISLDEKANWTADTVIVQGIVGENRTYCSLTDTSLWSLTRDGDKLVLTPTHTHVWAESWSYGKAEHWHECLASDCPATLLEKDGYDSHKLTDGVCSVCGVHTHPDDDADLNVYLPWTVTSGNVESGNYYLADNVTLTGDINLDGVTVKLCLNGKTIDLQGNSIFIEEGASLTVDDCHGTAGTIRSSGTLFINQGTLVLTNGNFSSTESAISNWGLLKIGSTVNGNVQITANMVGITNQSGATLTIYAGTIVSETFDAIQNAGTAHIRGGTIYSENSGYGFCNYDDTNSFADIIGGTITKVENGRTGYMEIGGTAQILGKGGENSIALDTSSTLVITGGTITNEQGYAIRIGSSDAKLYLVGAPTISSGRENLLLVSGRIYAHAQNKTETIYSGSLLTLETFLHNGDTIVYGVTSENSNSFVCSDAEAVLVEREGNLVLHIHAWSDSWSSDANGHWHECTVDGCPVMDNANKGGYVTHAQPDDDGDCTTAIVCKTCNYEFVSAKTHVYTDDCDKSCDNDNCSYVREPLHIQPDDDGDCTTAIVCDNCGSVFVEAKSHVYDDNCDATCNNAHCTAGNREITHTYGDWKFDENGHWKECACGEKAEQSAHEFDEQGNCVCGAQTHDETPQPAKSNVGAIIAISIGGVLLLALAGFAILWFVIKKKSWADLVAIFKK